MFQRAGNGIKICLMLNRLKTENLDDFVSFRIAGTCFDICLADEKSSQSCGGTVGYWLVDSLEGLIERATAIGGAIYRGPTRVTEMQRAIVQIIDPDGNVVGFEAPLDGK